MSKLLFTAEEDEILVEWVGKYPCLYDLKVLTYKDQRIKDSAWKEIAEVVKKTEADCRKRWKNIKDTYQKRKKKGTGTGSSADVKQKWFLASLLSFLEKTEYKRPSKSNIVEQDCASTPADETDDSDIEATEKSIVSCESDSAAASSSNCESNSAAASSSNREFSSAPASTSNYLLEEKPTEKPINKRKKTKQLSEMMEDRRNERNKVLQMISDDDNDDVSLFFKSIAASVKKLPSELINEAKMKTLQLVFALESRAKNTTTVPFLSPGTDSASSLVYSPPPQVIPAVSNNASGPYNDYVNTSGNNTNFLFTSNMLTGFDHT